MKLTPVTLARPGFVLPAAFTWSPDSRRLLTCRLDESALLDLPLVQHVPPGDARPVVHHKLFALRGVQAEPEIASWQPRRSL